MFNDESAICEARSFESRSFRAPASAASILRYAPDLQLRGSAIAVLPVSWYTLHRAIA